MTCDDTEAQRRMDEFDAHLRPREREAACPSDAAACSAVKGFRVVTDYFEKPTAVIIRTTTAARAKHKNWNSAHDAGYPIEWKSLKVKRAPEYDDCTTLDKDRCYSEYYAQSVLPQNDKPQATT